MAYDTGISSAVAQYVYTQSNGAVTEPIGGSYLQAYCEYLGATTLVGNSWLITLCDHFGITEPLNGSWTIALANHYGITYPTGGTWWQALAEASGIPSIPFIWDQDTNNWEAELRTWNIPVAPTADFTSDTVTIFEGESVQFTDTSTGLPTSWAWAFSGADQEVYTVQNPLVTYSNPGTYSVSLEATNAQGSDTKTVLNYMTVNVIPVVADFTSNTQTPIEGGTVQFTDTSTGTPTQWLWTLPGATPSSSTDQNPSVIYNTTGSYSVTLEASKVGSSDTETKINYINVVPPITATPITEFETNMWYSTASNPIDKNNFANSLLAFKLYY